MEIDELLSVSGLPAEQTALIRERARLENRLDAPGPQINQYGTVSPFAVLADTISRSGSRKKLRETTGRQDEITALQEASRQGYLGEVMADGSLKEEDKADLRAVLSGDPQMKEAAMFRLEERKNLRNNQATVNNKVQNIGNGVVYDPSRVAKGLEPYYIPDAYLDQVVNMAEAKRAVDDYNQTHKIEFEKIKAELAKGDKADLSNLDSGTRKLMAEKLANLSYGRDIVQLMEANPGAQTVVGSTIAGALEHFTSNSIANIFKGLTKTPEEQAARVELERFVADFRKAMAGTALSGFELSAASRWDPLASGIGHEESQRRLKSMVNAVERELGALGEVNRKDVTSATNPVTPATESNDGWGEVTVQE